MDRGDIEAFNAQRRRIEGKSALQLQQCIVDTVIVVATSGFIAHKNMTSILRSHVHKRCFFAPLGYGKKHLGTMNACKFFGKPFANDVIVFWNLFDNKLMRNRFGGTVIAQHKHAKQFRCRNILAFVENEFVGIHDAAFAQHKHSYASNGLLAKNANHVGVKPMG